jgi:MFS family permease
MTDPYAVWRSSAYRFLIGARACFGLGMQMQGTAVSWQIYEKFGTAMALAYVGLVQIVPVLLLAVPAGHVADHFDRRRIVMVTQTLFFSASLGLALLTWQGWAPGLIYVLLLIPATVRVFTAPAISALLPTLVPREHWANATKWNSSVMELSTIIGPALAGAIIAFSGGGTVGVYLTAAVLALTSVLFFSCLPPGIRAATTKAVTFYDLVGGLRFMWRTKLLLAAASLDLFSVLLGGATALLPIVAKDILHVGPHGFGWLRAAPSIGAVTMAIVTAHLPPWRKAGRVLSGAFVGFGLATIVFGLSRNFWLSMSMLFVIGASDNLNVVIRQTLVQYITPDEMRGRVSSINFIFIGCSNELGGFESGLTAQLFGTVPSIVGGGIGTLLIVALIMKLAPQLRKLGPLHEIHPAQT